VHSNALSIQVLGGPGAPDQSISSPWEFVERDDKRFTSRGFFPTLRA
jgi:hypothetical protein